jgi:hypothetical protein
MVVHHRAAGFSLSRTEIKVNNVNLEIVVPTEKVSGVLLTVAVTKVQ